MIIRLKTPDIVVPSELTPAVARQLEQFAIRVGERNRPRMLARRHPTPVERELQIAAARAGEQNQVRVGRCNGCGGAMPGGCSCDVQGSRLAVAGGVPPIGSHWAQGFIASPGCFPRGYSDEAAQDKLMGEPAVRSAPEPHSDAWWDYVNMDVLYSPVTSIAATGVPVNVDVNPQAGCFVAFYWKLIVRNPTTGVQEVDWTYRRPRIVGCPIPCDDIDRDILGQYAMYTPESSQCCGFPIRAFLQRTSENLPLRVPVTNTSAAPFDAQVEVRGFCCSTRIC